MECHCHKIGKGVQLFRVKDPENSLIQLEDLGPDYEKHLGSRQIWACKSCNTLYAYIEVPFKDIEKFIIRPDSQNKTNWNWEHFGNIAESCRWKGSHSEKRYLF